MYASYWGLAESPFRNRLDERWFCPSRTHEEALARLDFLIQQQCCFGVLSGPSGVGKSMLLKVLISQLKRTPREIVFVNLAGLEPDELLWNLAAAFRLAPMENDSRLVLWRSIQDHLFGSRQSVQTVLIFDHLDEAAGSDSLRIVERLQHVDGSRSGRLTTIVAINCGQLAPRVDVPLAERADHIPARSLAQLSDLRIELFPLDRIDTEFFIRHLLDKAGCQRRIFEQSALDALFERTAGLPHSLCRLCDLSLLAAMGDRLDAVSADIVHQAAQELLTSSTQENGLSPVYPDLSLV